MAEEDELRHGPQRVLQMRQAQCIVTAVEPARLRRDVKGQGQAEFSHLTEEIEVQRVVKGQARLILAHAFAAGVAVLGFLTKNSNSKFLATFQWTLIGCTVGALAIVWFGPMLIVFGMFAAGTASVVLKEVLPVIKKHDQL